MTGSTRRRSSAASSALRAGTSRLPSDVEQVGAVGNHLHTCFNGVRGIEEHAPVRERVRRDVDDAHHQRARTQFERTSTGQLQGESTTGIHEGNVCQGGSIKGQTRQSSTEVGTYGRTPVQLGPSALRTYSWVTGRGGSAGTIPGAGRSFEGFRVTSRRRRGSRRRLSVRRASGRPRDASPGRRRAFRARGAHRPCRADTACARSGSSAHGCSCRSRSA